MAIESYYDLDGTIVDTRPAVKAAYLAAGLSEYKDEYWGKTAAEWHCPPDVHARKSQLYGQYLHLATPGWAYRFYTATPGAILTGASGEAVQLLRQKFQLPLATPYGYSLDVDAKVRILVARCAAGAYIEYFEDQLDVARWIAGRLPAGRFEIVTPEGAVA